MGDALVQVLDLAETIQAGDAATGGTATPAPVDEPSGQPLVAAILLSDGASTTGTADPLEAADRAATMNVPIYTIALGTADGEVQVPDENGQPTTLQVPPDTETLAKIAETTDAIAFDAPSADRPPGGLRQPASPASATSRRRRRSRCTSPAAALLLVVAAAGLSALWFGRLP